MTPSLAGAGSMIALYYFAFGPSVNRPIQP
jgi:hypothetical protein